LFKINDANIATFVNKKIFDHFFRLYSNMNYAITQESTLSTLQQPATQIRTHCGSQHNHKSAKTL